MRFASLFAGVGGFDLAFERAGMECVAQVEIDDHCRAVLVTHWPDVPRFEDVHEVSGNDIGPTDLLCGGFPCQDYSVAGKRGGLAGDRGALWWQFHRLIDVCRPEWVVGENVPGLLSSNGGKDFGAIVGSLVELGYGVVWRVLDAQYFGVGQRRRRVFIVGHLGDEPRPEVLDLAEGCAWDLAPGTETGERVAALTANGLGGGGPDDNLAQAGHLIPSVYHKSSMDAGWEPGVRTLRARDSKGDSHVVVGFDWTQTGAQPLDDMSPTLRVGSGLGIPSSPAVAEGSSIRRLTPLECERLQGFPDNWTAGQSDTQRYRQMGNAVAVPVAEWVGHRLMGTDWQPPEQIARAS